jgi:nucleoside-diphosphate-sugar epimerase
MKTRRLPMAMSRILVTGGAGFIGSHLVDALIREGKQVYVLDDFSKGSMENLAAHIATNAITIKKGDIRNRNHVDELASKVDAVAHLAAIVDHTQCLKDPCLAESVNSEGTLNVLETAKECGVKRFVYASSAAVYGDTMKVPITELTETNPISPYGTTKLAGEKHCHELQSNELATVCLRFFNVFGPRQSISSQYSGVITAFMQKLLNGEPPIIHGDGLQTRDFVWVTDVVQGIVRAIESGVSDITFNIATGIETTIDALAKKTAELSGLSHLSPIHVEERRGDIKRSVADISKAKRELHYNPRTDLDEGLRTLWMWYQTRPEQKTPKRL